MPPNPEARICASCDHRDGCNNKSAEVCYDERKQNRINERIAAIPQMPRVTCSAYIGFNYDVKDRSGNGHCIDVFDVDGHLDCCKHVIETKMCPYGRTTPYLRKD